MLSVIIPVYNERAYIEEVLRRVEDSGLTGETIIVDDASTDGSRQFLQDLQKRQENGQREWEIANGQGKLRLDKMRFI